MAARVGPEYRWLMDEIRTWVTSGKYPVGKAIPSTSELSELTGLSIPVVRRAVSQLEEDGILEGHPGKGVYVKALPEDLARENLDIKALSEQVEVLKEDLRKLEERVRESDELREYVGELRSAFGRLEANVVYLYLQRGEDYPQGGTDDTAKKTARGRSRR